MSVQTRYLRLYPTEWPIFSIKNYVQDQDGWWNFRPKKRRPRLKLEVYSQILNNETPVIKQ